MVYTIILKSKGKNYYELSNLGLCFWICHRIYQYEYQGQKEKEKKSKKAKFPDKKTIRDEKKVALYAEKAKAAEKERDERARERKKAFEENNLRSLKISTGIPQSKKTIRKRVSLGDRIILRDEVGDLYSAPVVGKDSHFLGKTVGEKILIGSYECTIVSSNSAKNKKQSIHKE